MHRYYGNLSQLKPQQQYTLLRQLHKAKRAGLHVDFRLGSPQTGLFSWAAPKDLPTEQDQKRLLITQPLHTYAYKDFEGTIHSKYGNGTVKKLQQSPVVILQNTPQKIKFRRTESQSQPVYTMIRTKNGNYIMTMKKQADLKQQQLIQLSRPYYTDQRWNHIQQVLRQAQDIKQQPLTDLEKAIIYMHDSQKKRVGQTEHQGASAILAGRLLKNKYSKQKLRRILQAIKQHSPDYRQSKSDINAYVLSAKDIKKKRLSDTQNAAILHHDTAKRDIGDQKVRAKMQEYKKGLNKQARIRFNLFSNLGKTIGKDVFKPKYNNKNLSEGFNVLQKFRRDLIQGRIDTTKSIKDISKLEESLKQNQIQILKKHLNKLNNNYNFQDALDTLKAGDFDSAIKKFDSSVLSQIAGLKDKESIIIPSNILRHTYNAPFKEYLYKQHPLGVVSKTGKNKFSLIYNPNDAFDTASTIQGAPSIMNSWKRFSNTDSLLNTQILASLKSLNRREFGNRGVATPIISWNGTSDYMVYPVGGKFTPQLKTRYHNMLKYGIKRQKFIQSLREKGLSKKDIDKQLYRWQKINGKINTKKQLPQLGIYTRYANHLPDTDKFSGTSYIAGVPQVDKVSHGYRRYSLADTLDDIYPNVDFDIYATDIERIKDQLKAEKLIVQ